MHGSLQSLDLHHLSVLHALLTEHSVTRVAEGSGQAQPAVSRTLRRLREVLKDPLLVRNGARLVLTERAAELRAPLAEILTQVARMEVQSTFDPTVAEREFHIACVDCLPPELVPKIIATVTGAGPRIRIRMRQIGQSFDIADALGNGSVDLLINNSPKPREDLRIGPLFTDEVVCLLRAGHPLARLRRITLSRYLSLQHLAPHPSSTREFGPIDGELAKIGHRRNVTATAPEFNIVPYVLARTDLVFTTGRRFAEHYAANMGLVVVRAPIEFPPMRFYQLWHELNHASSANRWLRQHVKELAA